MSYKLLNGADEKSGGKAFADRESMRKALKRLYSGTAEVTDDMSLDDLLALGEWTIEVLSGDGKTNEEQLAEIHEMLDTGLDDDENTERLNKGMKYLCSEHNKREGLKTALHLELYDMHVEQEADNEEYAEQLSKLRKILSYTKP